MPLAPGSSPEIRSRNIAEMIHSGHPKNVSIAAAYANARRHPHAHGGHIEQALHVARKHFDFGGSMDVMRPPTMPFFAKMAEHQEMSSPSYGLVPGGVPGRTDRIPTDVPAGSYVMPADVVSGLGEGNTNAGAAVMHKMLTTGPHGVPLPHMGGRSTIPHPPGVPHMGGMGGMSQTKNTGMIPSGMFAKGGKTSDEKVPIIIAGGEFLIDPHTIAHHPRLGNLPVEDNDPKHYKMALKNGHAVLDEFVKQVREKTIKELKGLPGPRK